MCAADYGRRPVVAVLDSGVRAHPWLDVRAEGNGQYETSSDGFVQVDPGIQNVIREHAKRAGEHHAIHPITGPWDLPYPSDLLVRPVDAYLGHGTFIAGLVRQAVPDATLLSIRIMHSDGIIYEGDLLCALGLLVARVAEAQRDNKPELMVDALSLSLGYFAESSADVMYTAGLYELIRGLLDRGVLITAAAGNYTTRRRYYPAAFAGVPSDNPNHLVSVGALNPNGSRAAFSDGGQWVTAWAGGASLISTFPTDINGPDEPDLKVRDIETLDRDDYRGGFAAWSGTSFAAPAFAAHAIAVMLGGLLEEDSQLPRLSEVDAKAAIQRVAWSLRQFPGKS
jgi:subtilisin family serine protease